MTDKEQIMIDKVDVSKCFWLWVNTDKNYKSRCIMNKDVYSQCTYCKDHPNCLFKQLARKSQECEQKEKELLSNEKIINKLMKEVDELKQECEELKEVYEIVAELEIDNQECWDIAFLKDENTRYRKALEEIEGYFKKQDTSKTSLFNIFAIEQEILDIINKAKGETNE